ncbi:MAG: hypothetical protein K0Q74_927 [Gammaproteobacteria bacterium]|jgi:hypothetical protein|nr:hypothetical protein [Gammaproteobacteria bacterium]
MFQELPKYIQQQILSYLESDNFVAAKKLRDSYLASYSPTNEKTDRLQDENQHIDLNAN